MRVASAAISLSLIIASWKNMNNASYCSIKWETNATKESHWSLRKRKILCSGKSNRFWNRLRVSCLLSLHFKNLWISSNNVNSSGGSTLQAYDTVRSRKWQTHLKTNKFGISLKFNHNWVVFSNITDALSTATQLFYIESHFLWKNQQWPCEGIRLSRQ